MKNDLELERVLNAFDEFEFEKKTTSDLKNARNKQQMAAYIESLDYSVRRLKLLQETINEIVDAKQSDLLKQEKIQTYKTKIINLAREYGTSYQEVLNVMARLRK
ncbi:ribonuclease E inhibitor RraB [Shewanella aestuarii]|uniref:Uncharacterized protein n=1 Tax=Shewanella aestuarii TaxID=1028752 RepID=A0A6G9QL37_9GAMM|nr:ribonuclease E inhibitor RraB [Shewanella aestuarii]QIR14551.1 hypothetical protein HBH39_08680 [Shewanella aestuarii]